jgi:hypothetical protein
VTMQAPEFLSQLVRSALGRNDDIAEPTVAPEVNGPIQSNAPPVVEPPRREVTADPSQPVFDPGIVGVVAEKVLLAWLRNRYQLLFPFALNLRRLDKQQANLLVHAMIAAAQADGSFDGKERKRIEGTLNLVDASADEKAFLDAAMSRPKHLNDILGEVRDVQTGALVYAASLMAVDQRRPVNRFYLQYLAARLQLSDELVESLDQRYRSTS